MTPITVEMVKEARERIQTYVHVTPLLPFEFLSRRFNKNIWVKCESLQKTGSFKMRGAANCVLQNRPQASSKGVIAASAGNHAQGVAAICHYLGMKATIVMPKQTPPLKVQNTRNWGAEVVLHGTMLDESLEQAKQLAEQHGHLFVHAFKNTQIMAGQGTTSLELLEQSPFAAMEAIVIPVGGGGLITGMASVLRALRPGLKIYGICAASAPTFYESFRTKSVVPIHAGFTLAEGVATKKTDPEMLTGALDLIDEMIALDEKAIAHAIAVAAEQGKLILEGSGALPIAAILQNRIAEKNVTLVATGGNIDVPALSQVLHRGMVEQGRMVRLLITISDRPGGLAAVTQVLAEQGANILQVFHQRTTLRADIGETEIEVDLETRGPEHTNDIIAALTQKKFRVNAMS